MQLSIVKTCREPVSRECGARWLSIGLELIGDWWSPLIIRDLFLDVARFDELVEDLGISRNLLTRRLNALARNGIVERKAYQRRPTRYKYGLTEAGRDLVPAILALTAWGDRWAQPKEGSPIATPGPGGAAKPGTRVLARRLATAT